MNQLLTSFMNVGDLQNLYLQFLNNFPAPSRPIVSIGLAVLIVYSIFKIVRKDFLWIIVLIVLLPGSIPILESVWQGLVVVVKFLLNTK